MTRRPSVKRMTAISRAVTESSCRSAVGAVTQPHAAMMPAGGLLRSAPIRSLGQRGPERRYASASSAPPLFVEVGVVAAVHDVLRPLAPEQVAARIPGRDW